jgi:hypothetical protein
VSSSAVATAASRSGAFTLEVSGNGAEDVPPSEDVLMSAVSRPHTIATLRRPGKTVVLRITDRCQRAVYPTSNGRRCTTEDAMAVDDVAEWMRSAGLTVKDADPEAAAVYTLIRSVACGGGSLQLDPGAGRLSGLVKIDVRSETVRSFRPLVCAVILIPAAILWRPLMVRLRRSIERCRSTDRQRSTGVLKAAEQML